MIWTPTRRFPFDGWLPQCGRPRFDLRALMGVFTWDGQIVTNGGKVATQEDCCCVRGSYCTPCAKCVRGAWVTIPPLATGVVTNITCECSSVAGTYYVPVGTPTIGCTPSVTYRPFCFPTSAFSGGGPCAWPLRTGAVGGAYSCQGCFEAYWESIPGCDDNTAGDCIFTETGTLSHGIRGAIGWGIRVPKVAGVWVVQSYITYLDYAFGVAWTRSVTTSETGVTADCANANGDHAFLCGSAADGSACSGFGTVASLLLDFGPCPA